MTANSAFADVAPWPVEVTSLSRPDVDGAYQQWVALTPTPVPPVADTETTTEGVGALIVCLDAPWTFGTTVDVMRLGGIGKDLPSAAVVGLAHAPADKRGVLAMRASDFTVTPAAAPPEIGVRLPADQLGRAPQLLAWLASAVLPPLVARFQPTQTVLVGHSFSALFGVHVLLNQPELFDAYLLASPSVWWDDRAMFEIEATHAKRTNRLPARVFMSRGELETDDWSPHREFHAQFAGRNYEGLELEWAEFPGEGHMSVVPAAISRGLYALLGAPTPPA